MNEWQIATYAALIHGYERQCASYFARTRETPTGSVSPLACRRIERQTLEERCLRLMLQRAADLTGDALAPGGDEPADFDVDEPRLLQFLALALEWNEMA
jgi:hypothetical protein